MSGRLRYSMFIPDWHPPRANDWRGRHWVAAHKARKRMEEKYLAPYKLACRVPDATGPRAVSVLIVFEAGTRPQHYPDKDAWDKLLQDALVNCHLLTDDGPDALIGRIQVDYAQAYRGQEWGTQIILTEAGFGAEARRLLDAPSPYGRNWRAALAAMALPGVEAMISLATAASPLGRAMREHKVTPAALAEELLRSIL